MSPQSVTGHGVLVLLVLILAFDIWRDRSKTKSTISELFWGLLAFTRTRIALVVGLILGIFGGHLVWQSQRTYVAIRCEAVGGTMQCVLPSPPPRLALDLGGVLDSCEAGDYDDEWEGLDGN